MGRKLSEQRNVSNRLSGITMPIIRRRIRWGRNWPCLCGSEKKYKNCCLSDIQEITASDGNADVKEMPDSIKQIIQKIKEAEAEKGKGHE